MKKKRQKYYSIRKRFWNSYVSFALGLILTFIVGQGLLQFFAFYADKTLNTQEDFSTYWKQLNELDGVLYVLEQTPTEEFWKNGETISEHLVLQAESIDREIKKPRSRDLYVLTWNLCEEIRKGKENTNKELTAECIYKAQDKINILMELYNGFSDEMEKYIKKHKEKQFTVRLNASLGIFLVNLILAGLFILQGKNLANYVMHPVITLTSQVKEIIAGNKQIKMQYINYPADELGILNNAFCEMVDKNQKQMRQLKEQGEMEIKLERTRLSLLQSRVNPHFMFNILNIIAGLAVEEEAYRTRKFTIKTASYFRYSLDSLDKIVKLENEIKNVQLYLEIQKERFGEKVEWEISMQDECGKLEVPAMILQPLCENSIVHGMSAILKRVHILVSARVENEYLFLSVSDDGEGISEETINNINQKMRQHKKCGEEGIGIKNTFERLQMFCNGKADFAIESVPMEYTIVTFIIPLKDQFDKMCKKEVESE